MRTCELQGVQQEVTDAMESKGLWWKESSLSVMTTGENCGSMTTVGEKQTHTHKEVDKMVVLGVTLDKQGSTAASVTHRLAEGERAFHQMQKSLTKRGNIKEKLRVWEKVVATVALRGCRTWHVILRMHGYGE